MAASLESGCSQKAAGSAVVQECLLAFFIPLFSETGGKKESGQDAEQAEAVGLRPAEARGGWAVSNLCGFHGRKASSPGWSHQGLAKGRTWAVLIRASYLLRVQQGQ